jgi:hypothetical protein
LRKTLRKSLAIRVGERRVSSAKQALAIIFWRKQGERETASSRDSDWQEDETLVAGCPLSSGRSRLPDMASPEKLCSSLRPVPAHHDEVGP